MPQIIPLVVTAITAVTSAVVAAGPLAVAAFNAANVIGAAALANEAFKAVQPSVKSSSTAIEWNADPNAPNRFAFGRIGGAGNIIHNATYGPDKMFVGFVGVMSASGPIKSWGAFKADDAFVSFDGAGKAIDSDYAGEMWMRRQNGLQPEPSYLPSPSGLKNGAAMPRWGASYKLSGKAAYHYTLAENSKRSAYKGKVPTGIHYIEGVYCYDPRFDDTFPGGTGPCRIDDPTTWVYSTNAYIHGLNWNIGRWEGEARGFTPKRYGVPYASMKVGGIGAHPDGIDFAGYVEGANVFDENAWACAAWPDADQGKGAVLDSFLQTGGGIYAERQGKISCLHRAAPRTSAVTITADDTAGTIEYDTTTSLLERINTIRPEYWSEAHGWQMIATDEVTSSVWREEDGQGVEVTRSKGLAYNYVPGSKQARELAALQIAHTREGIRGTAPLRHYLDLDVGDCFTFEVPEAVLNGLKCIVLNVDPDLENDIINVTFASESDGKYPFAFGQAAAPPPAPGLQPADNTVSPPLPSDWVIVVRPPAPGGTQLPGFDLTGIVSNATATAIIVEHGPTAEGPWTTAYQGPPTVTTIPIDGLQSGETYFIAIQYQRNQNYSERAVYGPFTAPTLTAGISDETKDTIVQDVLGQVDTGIGEGLQAGKDALARSKELGRALIDAAVAALEGDLAEERSRSTEVQDVLDRIDVFAIADPVLRTGILRQQTMLEGVGPSGNETFVQMNTRLTAADTALGLAVATVLIDAKAYTTDQLALALLTLATKAELADSVAVAKLAMESYTDGKVSTATADLISAVEADGKISSARLLIEAWTNGQISTATAGLAVASQVAASQAASELLLKAYTDTKVSEGTALLASKAELVSGLSTSELSLKTYTDGKVSAAVASLISAAQVDAKIATASLTLSGEITDKIAIATADLISAVQLAAALAGSELSLKSYTDGQISSATALLASKAEVFANQNLMPNGSGELGLNGWSGAAGLQAAFWQPFGGQIVKQPIPGAASNWFVSGPLAGVSAAGSVTLSWRGGRDGGYADTANVYLVFRNSGGGIISETARKDISTADADKFVTAAVPAGAASAHLALHIDGSGGGGQAVWLNRVKIENGTVATSYTLDGSALALAATAAIQAEAIADAATKLSSARLRLVAAPEDGDPAIVELYSDSAGSNYIRFGAKQIGFGRNSDFEDETDTFVTTIGSVRYITAWGAPFGPDSLTYWVGPSTVATAAATKALAESVGGQWRDSTGDSLFGGKTLSGSFNTGAPNATSISLPKNTWTTIATVDKGMQATGLLMGFMLFDIYLTGAAGGDDDFGVVYRIAVTDPNGSNLVVVGSNFGAFPTNTWTNVGGLQGVLVDAAVNLASRGVKKIVLQVNPTGANISTAQARNGRARGLYGA